MQLPNRFLLTYLAFRMTKVVIPDLKVGKTRFSANVGVIFHLFLLFSGFRWGCSTFLACPKFCLLRGFWIKSSPALPQPSQTLPQPRPFPSTFPWRDFDLIGAPNLGSAEGGFVPISSDLFLFVLLVCGSSPICSDFNVKIGSRRRSKLGQGDWVLFCKRSWGQEYVRFCPAGPAENKLNLAKID